MASTLLITTSVVGYEYVITSTMSSDELPVDIFMYENTGTELGDYQGVCTLEEYKRLQSYIGADIPIFGNKFLKWNQAIVHIPFSAGIDPSTVSNKLVLDVKAFKIAYLASQNSTQTIII